MSTEKRLINFTLNGRAVSAEVAPQWNIVEMLQNSFGLMGARESCGQGLCGCCTVLIDGQAATGCLQLAALVDGKDVQTIEQIFPGEPTIRQEVFVKYKEICETAASATSAGSGANLCATRVGRGCTIVGNVPDG